MDDEILNELMHQDWQNVSANVLASALRLARIYGWDARSVLPNGSTVEDLVLDAIAELFSNPDRRNTDCKLVTQLKNIVRSKLWNLSQSRDEDVERLEKLEEQSSKSSENHELATELRDDFARAIQILFEHPKIKGKEDHELLILALSDGGDISDVSQLTELTGLKPERIYQLRRELITIYPEIKIQLLS